MTDEQILMVCKLFSPIKITDIMVTLPYKQQIDAIKDALPVDDTEVGATVSYLDLYRDSRDT